MSPKPTFDQIFTVYWAYIYNHLTALKIRLEAHILVSSKAVAAKVAKAEAAAIE